MKCERGNIFKSHSHKSYGVITGNFGWMRLIKSIYRKLDKNMYVSILLV